MSRYLFIFSLFIYLSPLAAYSSSSSSSSSSSDSVTYKTVIIADPTFFTRVTDINDKGVIIGYFDTGPEFQGFIRPPTGEVLPFIVPDYSTVPLSINKSSMITGVVTDINYVYHGFLRSSDGYITIFDAPGAGTSASQGTYAYSINQTGVITGYVTDSSDVSSGFIRNRSQTITFSADNAGTNPGLGTFALDINASGTTVGYVKDNAGHTVGFMRNPNAQITEFWVKGPASMQFITVASAINDQGIIVGYYLDENNYSQGYIREKNGKIVKFSVPGAQSTGPAAINNSGTITGYYSDGMNIYGFLRFSDGTYKTFIPPEASTGAYPTNINSSNAIVGSYVITDAPYSRGFLYEPVHGDSN
ncbi:MAG: DUF3466 family protein [Chlamydiales bacterium]|nr:DUF3466 family protein [Chlamydiales bacterium]